MVPLLKWQRQNLSLQNQITLVRCRLNLPLTYLGYQVNLSPSTIHATFHQILDLMYYSLTSSSQRNIVTIFVKQYTSFQTLYPKAYQHFLGHSHNLKAVPQNFMEVFKFDDIKLKK